jgi:hypothetical protein
MGKVISCIICSACEDYIEGDVCTKCGLALKVGDEIVCESILEVKHRHLDCKRK